jgi:hypothetical protein
MTLVIMAAVVFSAMAEGKKVADPEGVLEIHVPYISSAGRESDELTLREQTVLDKFGIKFVYEELIGGGEVEKLNLLFATGEEPEAFVYSGCWYDNYKRWGLEGYLLPIGDYLDKLPNYQKLWDKKTWDYVHASTKSGDGKLYWLPSREYAVTGYSWIYRKGAFDRMGLSFPKTLDSLYTTLKKIKAADPDSIPIAARWGVGWTMAGYLLAHRTTERWFIDPDTNKLEYGPGIEKFRDTVIYMNKIYREKMLDQEFPTSSSQQWREKYAQGKTYIQYSYYVRADWANQTMKDVDPDANWNWSGDNIIAYPGKEQMASRYGYGLFVGWGPALTTKCSEEKVERLLEFFDWCSTEEGSNFNTFGVEGTTFKYKDGKPVFMDHINTFYNPDGEKNMYKDYGFLDKSGGFLVMNQPYLIALFGPGSTDFQIAMRPKPYIKDQIAWNFTPEDDKERADLETVTNDIFKEYATKFIMGKLDPSNDADWDEYLTTINKAGLTRIREIREKAIKGAPIY